MVEKEDKGIKMGLTGWFISIFEGIVSLSMHFQQVEGNGKYGKVHHHLFLAKMPEPVVLLICF
jgi:hypothetical protein